jgi:hypothetical protein
MRVQYTLPGFVPAEASPSESIAGTSPFRSRLAFVPVPRWLSWERLLRLDQMPVDAASIEPPPGPGTLGSADIGAERLKWRQMLDRHVVLFGSASSNRTAEADESQAIGRMLALLMRYQEMEDAITARHLSEPEE